MKEKFLNWREYQKNMEPEERLTFGEKSPFSQISLPNTAVFIAWHGSSFPVYVANGAQGTIYVCRVDNNDPKPFNYDVYSIYSTESEETLKIIGPQKLEYHWSDDTPMFLKKYAPKWIDNKVRKSLPPINGTD